MTASIEIDDLPRTDRVEFLRQHMLAARTPLELRPNGAESVVVRARATPLSDEVSLLSTAGSGAAVHRTAAMARADAEPAVVLSLLTGGRSTVAQGGSAVLQRPGELVIYETSTPYAITFESGSARHSLTVSRSVLDLPERAFGAHHAEHLDRRDPVVASVTAFLHGLAVSARTMTLDQQRIMGPAAIAMTRALLLETSGTHRADDSQSLDARLLAYLERHFARQDLSAAELAAAHGISERTLYASLARNGIGLRRWLRERRLRAAAAMLVDPAWRTASISTIAHRWGFADHAHFSRTFRERYGVTPSDYRAG
ncbi:helix-turn-helix domain-containing protein [Amnibacterium flavum]|uniref:HTH araC/xylS-type domain-containing protein n=1 Tax=Amnibacterium flavum TaxID=2173173 RepID=A0A2V1HP54_9MICO|nr:helix-turn-helix domain-containing protein [Amnibacterium flavum]PVZ94305.1 hypothetical protein DDQ50_11260 [Amnibacterium flavum]